MLKAQVIGNIGSEPEVKTTKSGRQYLSFSVAHDRGRDVPTVWVRVVWFDGVGHRLQQYLRKGAKLCVTGDASVEAYADRMGQPASTVTVYPDSVEVVLYPKREDGAAAPAASDPNHAPVGTGARRPAAAPAPDQPYDGGRWGPGVPDYDRAPDFLKDDGDDMP